MATTSNFGITLLEQAQAQKEVTINQALNVLDAFMGNAVADKDLATPPGSPVAGVVYIVAASPTGAWAGKATQLAYFDQIWRFVVPQTGARVWVMDEAAHYRFDGTAWVIIAGGGGGGSGDVVGPASATDNAIARFDTTTGKLIQNSGVIIDDSNNISGVGTLASGTQTIAGQNIVASTSAQALAVGANGATNPALTVDASTASSVTGISIKSAASGGGVSITATSSAAAETLTIGAKGSSQLNLQTNGVTRLTLGTNTMTFAPASRSGTAAAEFGFTASAGSTLTASTEAPLVDWNLAATQSHNTGALTLQRDYRIRATSHLFTAASTLTNAATLAVDSAPIASTNATITNSSSIYSAGGAVGAGVTNSYGLNIAANTGGTNNYVARLAGSAGELFRVRTDGQIALLATNTAGGTTGAQTIDKPSGTVNFAAAATSLVVTNSLCTTSSIVFAVVRTNDTTAVIKNVVPAAGSFTINLNAAATAETSVGFFIIN